jgi:hypothetical protein
MSQQNQQQQMQEQHRMKMEQTGHRAATSMAMEQQQKRLENPEFLSQLQDEDVDTAVFDWVSDEYGPVFSGAHIIGNRSEHYEEQQELLNRNKAERHVAERTPGRLLRENPRLLALAQGLRGTPQCPDPTDRPEFRAAMTSRKKRVARDAAEVATNRQTLSIGGRGLDSVANVTVENRTMDSKEQASDSVASKATEVFR